MNCHWEYKLIIFSIEVVKVETVRTTDIPQLTVNKGTLGVHCIGNLLPASNLRGGEEDSRDSWVSSSLVTLVPEHSRG
jgi:hypothetical protein